MELSKATNTRLGQAGIPACKTDRERINPYVIASLTEYVAYQCREAEGFYTSWVADVLHRIRDDQWRRLPEFAGAPWGLPD